jgi:hypothetical protein
MSPERTIYEGGGPMPSGLIRRAGQRELFPLTTMYGVQRTTIRDQPPTP